MPHKSDEEIRKSIKHYEETLPDAEKNSNVQADVERTIERASQPLPAKPEKRPRLGDYTDTQTHSRNTEDISG